MVDIPGDSTTTRTIAVGGMLTDTLESAGDHDWIRINLTAGESLTIALNGVTLEDPYLRIRDANGNVVFENDDISSGTNRNSLLAFSATYTGTYYIDVGAWNEGYAGTYELRVTPYTPPPLFSIEQAANHLTHGYWGGTSHRFAVTTGGTLSVNLTGLTAEGQQLARAALATWTDIIGVGFAEVLSGGQITFDDNGEGASSSGTWSGGIISTAQVNVSTQWLANYGTALNGYAFQTYIHEIGHALGLGHAGNYNSTARYPFDATFQNDGWPLTVMSYFDQRENTFYAGQGFSPNMIVTPMMADILAVTSLYGRSTSTRLGDTVYGRDWTTSTGALTLFDSGGNDTIDLSNFGGSQRIDLNPGTFSNVLGEVGNVSIALGVIIENAIGGWGSDFILGNSFANVLQGGSGNDVLLGGAGADVLIGGGGSDIYEVDDIGDVLTELFEQGSEDVVFSYVDFTLATDLEHLVMSYGNQNYGYGNAGHNIIIGNARGNVLEGRGGYDTLTGGAGSDLFIVNPNFGVDVITDFVAGAGTPDAIYFSTQLFTSFQAIINNSAQVGADTWIGDGLGNTVVLQNVLRFSLHPDDFGFI